MEDVQEAKKSSRPRAKPGASASDDDKRIAASPARRPRSRSDHGAPLAVSPRIVVSEHGAGAAAKAAPPATPSQSRPAPAPAAAPIPTQRVPRSATAGTPRPPSRQASDTTLDPDQDLTEIDLTDQDFEEDEAKDMDMDEDDEEGLFFDDDGEELTGEGFSEDGAVDRSETNVTRDSVDDLDDDEVSDMKEDEQSQAEPRNQ